MAKQTQSGAYNYYHGFPTPGPQNPTSDDVLKHIFFADEATWKACREDKKFDFVVIGSGFCGFAFVSEIYAQWKKAGADMNAVPKVLMLERGSFFLPSHFQNLPVAFSSTVPPEQKYMSETFPWTLSHNTIIADQDCKWQHGMVPFVGGRSVLWSAWCPRPDKTKKDLDGWPAYITDMMTEEFFNRAEKLLHVYKPDSKVMKEICIGSKRTDGSKEKCQVYSVLQRAVRDRVASAVAADSTMFSRSEAAPMAIGSGDESGIDFAKFSVVGPLLSLATEYREHFTIVTNCAVSRIIHENGVATGLETSRGVLPLVVPSTEGAFPDHHAKVILAVGCMPAATLILNSFYQTIPPTCPSLVGKSIPGSTFSAHFITALTARLPRSVFETDDQKIGEFELGAVYLAGTISRQDSENHPHKVLQWHAQISAVANGDPANKTSLALRYQPDVVASASEAQLKDSKDHVVFVFAVLGEMDVNNEQNYFKLLPDGVVAEDKTANCRLQFILNENDRKLWNAMDEASFVALKYIAGESNLNKLEFWNGQQSTWIKCENAEDAYNKFLVNKFRVPGLVHESSLMPWKANEKESVVDSKFQFQGASNVFVTGSALWPTGASWNPTLVMAGFAQTLAKNQWDEWRCTSNVRGVADVTMTGASFPHGDLSIKTRGVHSTKRKHEAEGMPE